MRAFDFYLFKVTEIVKDFKVILITEQRAFCIANVFFISIICSHLRDAVVIFVLGNLRRNE